MNAIKKWFLDLELFEFFFINPLRTWWKARKYFKMPKPKFNFFTNPLYNCPFARRDYNGKILTIWSCDVGWKDKWNSPRHERDPFIYVCFFRKFGFSINFIIEYLDEDGSIKDGGMYYWEYLIDYLYYRQNLNKIDLWEHESKIFKLKNYTDNTVAPGKIYVPTHLFSLNRKGLDKFKEGLKND